MTSITLELYEWMDGWIHSETLSLYDDSIHGSENMTQRQRWPLKKILNLSRNLLTFVWSTSRERMRRSLLIFSSVRRRDVTSAKGGDWKTEASYRERNWNNSGVCTRSDFPNRYWWPHTPNNWDTQKPWCPTSITDVVFASGCRAHSFRLHTYVGLVDIP